MVKIVLYGNIASGKTTLCYQLEKYNLKCNEVELDNLNILRDIKDPLEREEIFYKEFERKEKEYPYINSNTKIIVPAFLELFGYKEKAKEYINNINLQDYTIIYLKTHYGKSYEWYLNRRREDSDYWTIDSFYKLGKILDKEFNQIKDKSYNYTIIEDIDIEKRVAHVINFLKLINISNSYY